MIDKGAEEQRIANGEFFNQDRHWQFSVPLSNYLTIFYQWNTQSSKSSRFYC